MSCNRFEKLIPLYVEGDLEADELRDVAEHVRGCHRCARLSNHYNASQAWLQALTPPEFDEAFFAGLKQSVMREIKSGKSRPTAFQWFTLWWKPAYGLAFLLLILLGALAFYVQMNRPPTRPNPVVAVRPDDNPQPEKKNEPQEKQAPQPELKNSEPPSAQQANLVKPPSMPRPRVKDVEVKLPPMNLEPIVDAQISLKDKDAVTAEEMSEMGFYISSEEMTRIEIQTSDPNIRIIWFAPKTVDLPKTMTE